MEKYCHSEHEMLLDFLVCYLDQTAVELEIEVLSTFGEVTIYLFIYLFILKSKYFLSKIKSEELFLLKIQQVMSISIEGNI